MFSFLSAPPPLPVQEIIPPPPQPAAKAPSPAAPPTPQPPPPRPAPRPVLGKDHTEAIKGIRKAMVKTMTAAQAIPPFGYYDEIDMTALVKFRTQIKETALARGVRFSYMPVFIKVDIPQRPSEISRAFFMPLVQRNGKKGCSTQSFALMLAATNF